MARSTLRLFGQHFGQNVALLAAAGAEDDAPVWIQIAREGEWLGHSQVRKVKWDRAFFTKLIANFRAHPAYKAGPDGLGTERVVPFDYEHASEQDATSGTIPVNGAPAPAWSLDLKLQDGDDGKVELWSWTSLGEKARGQIRAKEYLWTSVAIFAEAIDPVTGENIGPVLSSVAFTNHPFVQGMKPMAARIDVWGTAESREELIVGLRDILELDETATPERLLSELKLLHTAWMSGPGMQLPGFPEGVGGLLDRVRRLTGLRALATADEIIASVGQKFAEASDQPPQPQEDPLERPMAEVQNNTNSRLATLYGVKEKEDAILAAAEKGQQALGSLERLQALFGSSDTQTLLQDAQAAIDAAEKARPLVEALSSAAGSLSTDDQAEVESEVEKVAASMRGANKDQLRVLATAKLICRRYGEVIERLQEFDKAEAEAEVSAIVATLAPTEEAQKRLFPVMLSQRLDAGRDPKKLEAFRKEFPVPDAASQYLRTPLVATRGGTQLGGEHTARPVQMSQGAGRFGAPPPQRGQSGGDHPLMSFPGANKTLKAASYLCAKRDGFKQLPKQDQIFQAGQYLREGAPVL